MGAAVSLICSSTSEYSTVTEVTNQLSFEFELTSATRSQTIRPSNWWKLQDETKNKIESFLNVNNDSKDNEE